MNRADAWYRMEAVARAALRHLPPGTDLQQTIMHGLSMGGLLVVRFRVAGASNEALVYVGHYGGEMEIHVRSLSSEEEEHHLYESAREVGRHMARYLGPNPPPLDDYCTPC